MTNEELVRQIRAGQDERENMAVLWKNNTGVIYQIVKKYSEYAEIDDLMQEAYLGLVKAVQHYDQGEGVSFIGYARYWITQMASRYVKANSAVRVPEYAMHNVGVYNKAYRNFMQDYARKPTEDEMSRLTGLSHKELREIKRTAKILNTGSLDVPICEGEKAMLYDIVPAGEPGTDEKDSVLDKVQNEELAVVLWEMVDKLPGKQPQVIRGYFKENKTLKEIGEAEGFSIERGMQIKQKGLRELRHPKHSRILRSFKDEWYYCKGLSGNGVGAFKRSWTSSTERTALKSFEQSDGVAIR